MAQKFRYRNEAEFSKAFCLHLRKKGWFVQRIESGLTGKGIPDIYAVSPRHVPWWFELKRNRGEEICGTTNPVYIHWRPGQQPWLHDIATREQQCATIACFDDALLCIRHDKIYKCNKVTPYFDCSVAETLNSLV